jgi:hypothetical protein
LNFDGRHDGWPYKFLHRISDRAIWMIINIQ